MEDRTLLKIALMTAIIGLSALYYVSAFIPPAEMSIFSEVDEKLILKGKITSIRETNSSILLMLERKETVPVVLFNTEFYEALSLRKGDNVKILGTLQEYKGRQSVVANSVSVG